MTAVSVGGESPSSNVAYAFVDDPSQGFASTDGPEDVLLVAVPEAVPDVFEVHGLQPNPVRGSGRLRVDLPESAHVRARVYDALGRLVLTVTDAESPAGYRAFDVDTRSLPSGVYLYRVEAGGHVASGSFTVAR